MQLVPKRTKYRKMQKGNNRGTAYRGCDVDFGDFAMQATEPGRLTGRQIEAARMAITRHVKRAGKLWIRIFPHRPVTKKPLEVRMGGGKGGVEEWAADILPGRVMYEISGIDEKAQISIAGGSPPDIVGLWNYNVPAFAASDATGSVPEYWTSWSFCTSQ
jgi:large subunit ribosomal protein L16